MVTDKVSGMEKDMALDQVKGPKTLSLTTLAIAPWMVVQNVPVTGDSKVPATAPWMDAQNGPVTND